MAEKQIKTRTEVGTESSTQSQGLGQEEEEGFVVPFSTPPDVFSSIPPLLLSHIVGVLLIYLPQPASVIGDKFDLGHEDAVGLAIAAFVLVRVNTFSFSLLWQSPIRIILAVPLPECRSGGGGN